MPSLVDNAATQTIAAEGNAPTPRVGTQTTALNNSLYLFSGRGGIEMKPIEENGGLWRYAPNETRWELVTPADADATYPAGRSYHAITSDRTDTIYIHAGCPESGRLCDFWSFNVTSRTWTQLPEAPAPGRGGTSIAWAAGKVYRMNGFDGSNELGGAVDVFDTSSATWSTIAFAPDGVQGPGARSVSALLAVSAGGKEYLATLFGERDPSALGHAGAGKMLSDVWLFELASQTWLKVEAGDGEEDDKPAGRGWFDADVAQDENGKQAIIVHGGLAADNSRLGDVWRLEF